LTQRHDDLLEADLSAYLDGELSPERARDVEQYLAESESARRLLEELRAVSDRLAGLPRLRAPDELTAAMARHAERRVLFGDEQPRRPARVIRLFVQLTASAAVIAACIFVGWQVMQPTGVPPGPRLEGSPLAKSEAPSPSTEARHNTSAADEIIVAAKPADTGKQDVTARALFDQQVTPSAAAPLDVAVAAGPIDTAVTAPPPATEMMGLPADDAESLYAFFQPESDETAVVSVLVRPENDTEYQAAVALLDHWTVPPASAAAPLAGSGSLGEQGAAPESLGYAGGAEIAGVERTYTVPAADIERCITLLEVSTPQRVSVELSLAAAHGEVLAQVEAAAKRVPVVFAFRLPQPGEGLPFGTQDRLAGGGRGGVPDARYGVPMVRGGRAVYREKQAAREAEQRLADASRGQPSAPASAGVDTAAPSGPPRKFLVPDDQKDARKALSARHRAATEEPEIVIVPAPESRPAAPAPEPAPAVEAGAELNPLGTASAPATSQPASEGVELDANETLRQRLVQQILDTIRRRNSAAASRPVEVPASQPASELITLRVQVLPPPAASQPASAPTTDAAASQP
jgi:anti-sigma factor RsiW